MILLSSTPLYTQKKSDWNAASYSNNSKPQHEAALNALSRLTLRGNEAILDIGCGDGKITAHIARLVPNGSVHGIDASSTMVDFAQKSFGDVPNLSFEHIDANSFSYDQQLDVITSFACLHLIENKQDVFHRSYKSLQRDGTLLVLLTDGLKFIFQTVLEELFTQPAWRKYKKQTMPLYLVTKEELETTLTQARFTSFTVEETATKFSFPTKQDLCNWLNGHVFRKFLPQHLRNRYAREAVALYLNHVPLKKDGSVDVVFPRFLIKATKT